MTLPFLGIFNVLIVGIASSLGISEKRFHVKFALAGRSGHPPIQTDFPLESAKPITIVFMIRSECNTMTVQRSAIDVYIRKRPTWRFFALISCIYPIASRGILVCALWWRPVGISNELRGFKPPAWWRCVVPEVPFSSTVTGLPSNPAVRVEHALDVLNTCIKSTKDNPLSCDTSGYLKGRVGKVVETHYRDLWSGINAFENELVFPIPRWRKMLQKYVGSTLLIMMLKSLSVSCPLQCKWDITEIWCLRWLLDGLQEAS